MSMSESSLITNRVTERDAPTEPTPGDGHSVFSDAVIAAAPCTAGEPPVVYTPAERFMRRVLFIRDPDPDVPDAQVNKLFETSILISAIRCTLAYVVFP
ncbi:MAG TPA: hypothetical protein VFN21_07915, partial [Acidimicrobiales bacterium]|nr:hypothetical protein [Acidimicrobiales bacterium]